MPALTSISLRSPPGELTALQQTSLELRAQLANANLSQANLYGVTGFDPTDHDGVILNKTTLPDGNLSD